MAAKKPTTKTSTPKASTAKPSTTKTSTARARAAAKRGPKSPMTDEHKNALAVGRTESKAVREYLESLRANKPRRGRRRTSATIRARLNAIDTELLDTDPVTELKLRQERKDLSHELDHRSERVDHAALEDAS